MFSSKIQSILSQLFDLVPMYVHHLSEFWEVHHCATNPLAVKKRPGEPQLKHTGLGSVLKGKFKGGMIRLHKVKLN